MQSPNTPLNPDEAPDQVSEHETSTNQSSPKTPSGWQRLFRANLTFAALQSIILRVSIIVIILFVLVFVYQELTDRSYRVQAFSLPEDFVNDGYTGTAIALLLMDDVDDMVTGANIRRSVSELEEYNQASDRVELQVEVGGVGISPENIAAYLRRVFGAKPRTISGVIVRDGEDLKMILRMSGHASATLVQPYDSTGVNRSLEELVRQGAATVLKWNNPLLSGLYLYKNEEFAKAVESFRIATVEQAHVKSKAFAHWGDALLNMSDDTVAAARLVRKALALDPKSGTAYRLLGNMATAFSTKKAEMYFRRAIEVEPTSSWNWSTLGLKVLFNDTSRQAEAMTCLQKSYELDHRNIDAIYGWCHLLYLSGDYDLAYEKLQSLKYLNPRAGNVLNIAISEAIGDTVQAAIIMDGIPDKQQLADGLNELAYYQELRKNYPVGIHLAQLSLHADSTSEVAQGGWSTLAELCALTGNTEGFYRNVEKAMRLGYDVRRVAGNDPYTRFVNEERYRKLVVKYEAMVRSKR